MPGAEDQSDRALAVEGGVSPTENESLGSDSLLDYKFIAFKYEWRPLLSGTEQSHVALEKSGIALVSDLEQVHSLFECEHCSEL